MRRSVLLVAVLSASLGQAAQERAQAPVFDSTITVVSLPVFVTDDGGKAVVGLRAEDFEVMDEGKTVPVVGFQAFDAQAAADAEEEAAGTLRDLPPAARRQFLLLFDLSFSTPQGIMRAREAATDFVTSRLGPSDLAGVATYSPNHGMRLLVGFTTDRHQLRKAVTGLGVLNVDRRMDPLGIIYDLREVGHALADVEPAGRDAESVRQMMKLYEEAQKKDYVHRVNGFIEGLGTLAQAIDTLEGRKQIVLFSHGFDELLLTGNQSTEQAQDSEAVIQGRIWEVPTNSHFGDSALRGLMDKQLRSFSRSDAVVHAVDLGGLSAGGDARQSADPTSVRPVGPQETFKSGLESLAQIASKTGGHLFTNTNDLKQALSEVNEMSRHYYLLAFEPAAIKGPGTFHRLKVRLKRKGTQVAHRSGYYERRPYKELTPLAREFEAAEVIVKGMDRGEIVVTGLAVPYRGSTGDLHLPVVLELEPQSLLSGHKGGPFNLELYGYALNPQGEVQDTVSLAANLDLAKVGPLVRERGLQLHATFTLEAGPHDLRFLVRDKDSGRSGTYWLQVTVPSFASTGVTLFPPLVMGEADDWLVLPVRSTRSAAAESPFRVADQPFAPRPHPRLERARAERVCLLAFDGGVRYDPGASFEITPQLVDKEGAVARLHAVRVERSVAENGFRWFVLSFSPEAVTPGDYTLRVRLRDPASGRVSEAFQAVTVASPN
jgi:VWFA-related protein